MWADRYDRDLTDIFEIQDEISKAIVDALKVKLLPAEKKAIEDRGTSNVEAYNLYLMARQQWISGNFGNVRRDASDRPPVQAGHPARPRLRAGVGADGAGAARASVRARPGRERAAGRRTSARDQPGLPEAHCIKARYLEEEGRAEEAEKQIGTALKLDPEFVGSKSRGGADAVPSRPNSRSDPVFRESGIAHGRPTGTIR